MALDTTYHEHNMRSQRFYAYGFNAGQNEEFATAADAWEYLVRDGKDATIPRDFNQIRTTWDQQDALMGFGAGFTAGKLAPVVKRLDSGMLPVTYMPLGVGVVDTVGAEDEQWVEVDTTATLEGLKLLAFTDMLDEETSEDTFTADLAGLMIADAALTTWSEFKDRSVGRRILVRLDKIRKEHDTLWPIG